MTEFMQALVAARRWLPSVLLLASMALLGGALFPKAIVWTDEADYVSTAVRMGSTGKLLASTHLPPDLLAHGTWHKPVHMPAYMVLLAAWLKAGASPISVVVLNLGFFLATVVLVLGSVTDLQFRPNRSQLAAVLAVAATPLAFVYANTAMMESFVLLLGAAMFVVCFHSSRDWLRLGGLYGLALLGFITRETLVLFPLSLVATHAAEVVALHRRLLQRSLSRWLVFLGLACSGLALAMTCATGHGSYPNFVSRVASAGSWPERATLLWGNLRDNLRFYGQWQFLEHDILHTYTIAIFAVLALATVASRRGRFARQNAALFAYFVVSWLVVIVLYDNFGWRSHRVLLVNCFVGSLGICRWLLAEGTPRARRLVGALLVAHVVLAGIEVHYFAPNRTLWAAQQAKKPHILTTLGLVRSGDLLFSNDDFQFLAEHPDAQLMWMLPASPVELARLIAVARPRFVMVADGNDLTALGYQKLSHSQQDLWLRASDAASQ